MVAKITDASGADVTSNPPIKTNFGYTNRETDRESDLMYYRARYYSPDIGRFISQDPHPGSIEAPITFLNKYVYVINNPQIYTDPSGLFLDPVNLAIIGAVVGGINAHQRGENVLEGMFKGALAGFTLGKAAMIPPGFGPEIALLSAVQAGFQEGNFVDNFITNVFVNSFTTLVVEPLLPVWWYNSAWAANTIRPNFGLLTGIVKGASLLDQACHENTVKLVKDNLCWENLK